MYVPGGPNVSSVNAVQPAQPISGGYSATVNRIDGKFKTIDFTPNGGPVGILTKPSFHLTVGGTRVTASVSEWQHRGLKPPVENNRDATRDELVQLKTLVADVAELGPSEKATIIQGLDEQIAKLDAESLPPTLGPVLTPPFLPLTGKAKGELSLFD